MNYIYVTNQFFMEIVGQQAFLMSAASAGYFTAITRQHAALLLLKWHNNDSIEYHWKG